MQHKPISQASVNLTTEEIASHGWSPQFGTSHEMSTALRCQNIGFKPILVPTPPRAPCLAEPERPCIWSSVISLHSVHTRVDTSHLVGDLCISALLPTSTSRLGPVTGVTLQFDRATASFFSWNSASFCCCWVSKPNNLMLFYSSLSMLLYIGSLPFCQVVMN